MNGGPKGNILISLYLYFYMNTHKNLANKVSGSLLQIGAPRRGKGNIKQQHCGPQSRDIWKHVHGVWQVSAVSERWCLTLGIFHGVLQGWSLAFV